MLRRSGHIEQAVRVGGGGKSLSVLAAPKDERTDASYQISPEARKTLVDVLAEDIETPDQVETPTQSTADQRSAS